MTQLGALLFADWRVLVNDARRVVRSPGRLTLWCIYVLLLGLFAVTRVLGHGSSHADVVRADYVVCALLATLAVSLASGRGAIGIFRSRAEARLVIGSSIAAPVAIAYLQAREVAAQALRLCLSFVYLAFVFGPRRIGPLAIVADLVFVIGLLAAAAAVVVPRRLLSRPAGIACAFVGVPLAALTIAPAIRDATLQFAPVLPAALVRRVVTLVPAWHPGAVLLAPDPRWLVAVLAIAAGAIAILAARGRDAYPELYALSIARIDRIERIRQRRAGIAAARHKPAAAAVLPAPRGVLIFVWKSVVELTRRKTPLSIAAGGLLWCGAGFVAGRVLTGDREALFAALVGALINVMLVVGIGATNAIAGEVRRPLFWLADSALFERLSALVFAQMWRPVVTLEAIAVGFAAGGGTLLDTLVLAVGLPVLAGLLVSLGFAAFALFPSVADARGPVTLLRLGVSIVLLIPPFVLYGIAAWLVASPLAGLVAAALLACIEAGALIGLAAWRLDGRIDRVPA